MRGHKNLTEAQLKTSQNRSSRKQPNNTCALRAGVGLNTVAARKTCENWRGSQHSGSEKDLNSRLFFIWAAHSTPVGPSCLQFLAPDGSGLRPRTPRATRRAPQGLPASCNSTPRFFTLPRLLPFSLPCLVYAAMAPSPDPPTQLKNAAVTCKAASFDETDVHGHELRDLDRW